MRKDEEEYIKNEFNALINSYEKEIKKLKDRIALMNLEHSRQYNLLMGKLVFERQNPIIYLPSGKQLNAAFLNDEQLEYLESLMNNKQK